MALRGSTIPRPGGPGTLARMLGGPGSGGNDNKGASTICALWLGWPRRNGSATIIIITITTLLKGRATSC